MSNKLTFADICASPGGFSEYVLQRTLALDLKCQGWGISLVHRNEQGEACEWEISSFEEFGVVVRSSGLSTRQIPKREAELRDCNEHAATTFPTYHVSTGADGTGDLYKLENINYFADEVHSCDIEFVDLVVADGGFDYTQRRGMQEAASTKLILCEVLTMFKLLRIEGNFVLKVFDISQSETQRLLRLLSGNFCTVTIIKPVTR